MSIKVLLFSGGVDSFIAYRWYKLQGEKVIPLYVDLGTEYSLKERTIVRDILPNVKKVKCRIPQIKDKNAFIPARNLLLATIGVQFGDEIILGGLKDDNCEDKNEQIFQEFSELLTKISRKDVKVVSPFRNMTKDDIVKWYLESGGSVRKLKRTISCYKGKKYCGSCPSCFRKRVVFNNNGIRLDFKNKELIKEYKKKMEEGLYDEKRAKITLDVIEKYGGILQ